MKILASDYDGTIRIDGKISKDVMHALKRWRKAGNKFGIVTGRSTKTLRSEIEENQFELDFSVCNNGGVILDEKFKVIKLSLIEFGVVEDILKFIHKKPCKSYTVNDGHKRAVKILDATIELEPYMSGIDVLSVDEFLKNGKIGQIVVAFYNQEVANTFAKEINEQYGEHVVAFANVDCVDIVPRGVSKATGVAYVAKKNEYEFKDIYTIGDSYNDLSMLDAYQGATLHHAVDEIKENRLYIVKDVKEFIDILMGL